MADSIPAPFDVKLMNIVANIAFAMVALMLLAAGAWWVLRQPFFPIVGIKVDGEVTHNNAVTLRANVAPWVRSAVVRREFPNKLRVTLTEQVPVAIWGDEAGSKLINGFGDVFEANVAEVDDNLPRLDGPIEQAGQVLGMYRVLQPQFQPYDFSIDELTLSSRGSWKVVLDTGAEIELGRGQGEEVTARLQRFLKTVTQVAGQYHRTVADVEGADLRHNDAYALRLRGVTTVSPEAPRRIK
jgi:cell division protein FtsQ